MAMWNPWRGCHRYSEGCRFCYIHKGDVKRGVDTGQIVRTENFDAPVARKKNGEYRMKPGQLVYLCFSTDFLLEDADEWRGRCWEIIRESSDLNFLFLTKRIERFLDCIPADWGEGYDNVIVGCTVENQHTADIRLPIFSRLPVGLSTHYYQFHTVQIRFDIYFRNHGLADDIFMFDGHARPLCYDWVLKVREGCIRKRVAFEFRQLGTHFVKDGKEYTVQKKDLCAQARKANINFRP